MTTFGGNAGYYNIKMLVYSGQEYSNGRKYAAYKIKILKWPKELEIVGALGCWWRNSNIRYDTGLNTNVSELINNVNAYASYHGDSLTSDGYSDPNLIPEFIIGTSGYSQPSDSGSAVWLKIYNTHTKQYRWVGFGAHKSWIMCMRNWVTVRGRYDWPWDTCSIQYSGNANTYETNVNFNAPEPLNPADTAWRY